MGASWEPTTCTTSSCTGYYAPPPPPHQSYTPSSSSVSVPTHTILVVVIASVVSLVALLFCMIVAKSCAKGCREAAEEIVDKPNPPKPAAAAPKEIVVCVPTSCRCNSSICYNSFHCNFCGACCRAACHCSNRFTC